jgi:hypothetical protein
VLHDPGNIVGAEQWNVSRDDERSASASGD